MELFLFNCYENFSTMESPFLFPPFDLFLVFALSLIKIFAYLTGKIGKLLIKNRQLRKRSLIASCFQMLCWSSFTNKEPQGCWTMSISLKKIIFPCFCSWFPNTNASFVLTDQ